MRRRDSVKHDLARIHNNERGQEGVLKHRGINMKQGADIGLPRMD